MKKKSIPYDQFLIEELRADAEFRIAYLNACLEDEDPKILLLAIRDVMLAEGKSVADLAKDTGLNRENLYKVLSGESEPFYTTAQKILKALGLKYNLSYA